MNSEKIVTNFLFDTVNFLNEVPINYSPINISSNSYPKYTGDVTKELKDNNFITKKYLYDKFNLTQQRIIIDVKIYNITTTEILNYKKIAGYYTTIKDMNYIMIDNEISLRGRDLYPQLNDPIYYLFYLPEECRQVKKFTCSYLGCYGTPGGSKPYNIIYDNNLNCFKTILNIDETLLPYANYIFIAGGISFFYYSGLIVEQTINLN